MTVARAKKALAVLALLFLSVGCMPTPKKTKAKPPQNTVTPAANGNYGEARVLALLKNPDIDESSGLVASQTPRVYWTHNDSGDGPFIYAIDETGASRGVWRVVGADAADWEDISAGPGPQQNRRYLYIGDIGDNSDNRRGLVVYRIPEPVITANDVSTTPRRPALTEPAEIIRLRFPDGNHDAEALMIHPQTGDLYIVTKVALANPSLYKATAPLSTEGTITLVKKRELEVPSVLGGAITGGAISPDGRQVALCDYLQGYELDLPPSNGNFDDIWNQPMKTIDLGKRKQGEAIAFRLDGKALLATSEGKMSPLIQVLHR